MPPGDHTNRHRALAFGSVADLYDRYRPSYPGELIDDVLAAAACPAEAATVVDVGCGTGKATELFAARGARVAGVEPDSNMAEAARRRCSQYPSVNIVVSPFEQ